MRTILRLLLLGCVATGSLALAGTALAKTPQLLVKGSPATAASAETVIEVKEVKEDAAPLRIGIYLPIGYTANITQAAGTQIGTVNADLQALLISPDARERCSRPIPRPTSPTRARRAGTRQCGSCT
jgi:hypothetical protein